MASGPTNPTEYIQGHLTHLAKPIGDAGGFWTLHVDSVVMAVLIGVVSFGFLWWVTRRVTTGVPSKRQAFVELALEFVNGQARGVYHGHSRLVGPLSLTVFVFVLMMNAMDFLPVDITAKFTHLFADHWRVVPTADINTTFALALSVFFLMICVRHPGQGPRRLDPRALHLAVRQVSAAVADQPRDEHRRARGEAAVALAAAVRQHVRRRGHLPAARHVGGRPGSRGALLGGVLRAGLGDLPHPDRRRCRPSSS